MRQVAWLVAAMIAFPVWGWERVCTSTFDRAYEGVKVGQVKVYRNRMPDRTWTYAVGLSKVSVTGRSCPRGEIPTAYVSAKITSSSGGYLDTGDIKARGLRPTGYWKVFDQVFLRDCAQGIRLWTSWRCEKAK